MSVVEISNSGQGAQAFPMCNGNGHIVNPAGDGCMCGFLISDDNGCVYLRRAEPQKLREEAQRCDGSKIQSGGKTLRQMAEEARGS